MRAFFTGLAIAMLATATASAATLSDAKVGFSADRLLVVNGKPYHGKMWNMPGKERHEQDLNGIPVAFVLRNDTPVGDLVLPKLHTTVEFVMPPELRLFDDPRLVRKPVGHDLVNGITTTKYDVEVTVPEGHGTGDLWLSDQGIPMKLDGTFTRASGRVATLHWELTHVHVGPQPPTLFEPPAGFSKLPAEAITPLLGLKFKGQ
ncbi:MAG TPA: hypothetical protein VN808_08260 [Stellaceae bacterium]|nr:hypothetical protein [Stellaceae bacterium]